MTSWTVAQNQISLQETNLREWKIHRQPLSYCEYEAKHVLSMYDHFVCQGYVQVEASVQVMVLSPRHCVPAEAIWH
jgi:hypothetical protein